MHLENRVLTSWTEWFLGLCVCGAPAECAETTEGKALFGRRYVWSRWSRTGPDSLLQDVIHSDLETSLQSSKSSDCTMLLVRLIWSFEKAPCPSPTQTSETSRVGPEQQPGGEHQGCRAFSKPSGVRQPLSIADAPQPLLLSRHQAHRLPFHSNLRTQGPV